MKYYFYVSVVGIALNAAVLGVEIYKASTGAPTSTLIFLMALVVFGVSTTVVCTTFDKSNKF